MRIFALMCLLALLYTSASGQTVQPVPDSIRLSKIRLSIPIASRVTFCVDSGKVAGQINQLPRKRSIPIELHRKLDPRLVGKPIYIEMFLVNDLPDTSTVFFLPGFYVQNIKMFRQPVKDSAYQELPPQPLAVPYDQQMGFLITMPPGEKSRYVAEVVFIRTTVNSLNPTLCFSYCIQQLINEKQNERKQNAIISYLICGIMLMMIFYSLAGFYTSKSIEFIYYASYSTLLLIMFFFKAYSFRTPLSANYFFESYFDFVLQGGGTLFYLLFLKTFLQTRQHFPWLNAVLNSQLVITAAGLAIFSVLFFFTDLFVWQNTTENLVKYAWSFSTIFLIGYAVMNRSAILRYVAIGHCFLFIGGLLSLFLINSTHRFSGNVARLTNDSLFWYEMGVLFELVFFLIALSYKNKQDISARAREKERLVLAFEKESIERKMAILGAQQDERNRISADMHDELGSGVTAIRLLSELAKAKMKDQVLPEVEKISQSANELIGKMNTIIWTMQSSNDSVDNLIAYIRNHAVEFFDNTEIVCRVIPPDYVPPFQFSGEKRRNIFLCVKESLNNVVKHARATEVILSFSIEDQLFITIFDNGRGLNKDSMRLFSNGLTNMRKRMENIGGSFSIESDNGTMVRLIIPIVE